MDISDARDSATLTQLIQAITGLRHQFTTAIGDLEGRSVASRLISVGKDIEFLREGLDHVDRKVDSLDRKVDSVDRKVDDLDRKFTGKFDGLETKFDGLDGKVDQILARLK
jgi:hypothetical protein